MNTYKKRLIGDDEYIYLPPEKWKIGDVVFFGIGNVATVVDIKRGMNYKTFEVTFDDDDDIVYTYGDCYWVLN